MVNCVNRFYSHLYQERVDLQHGDGRQVPLGGSDIGAFALVQEGEEEAQAANHGRDGDVLQHGDCHQAHSGGGGRSCCGVALV